jgi:hypothetical protein
MRKEAAIFKALIDGDVTIDYRDKIHIKKAPGDTTIEAAHQ